MSSIQCQNERIGKATAAGGTKGHHWVWSVQITTPIFFFISYRGKVVSDVSRVTTMTHKQVQQHLSTQNSVF